MLPGKWGNQRIYHCRCVSLSASYSSQVIDRNYISDCSRCTAQSTRTWQSHFHLFRSAILGLRCLTANSFLWCCFAFSSLFTAIIAVIARTLPRWSLRNQDDGFNPSTRIFLYMQPFHVDFTWDDRFGIWISLLHSFCDRYAARTTLPRRRSLNQPSHKDPILAKLLGHLPM